MGSFRQGGPSFGGGSRGGFSRGRDGGSRGGGFESRPRRFGGRDRENRSPAEMHEATCSKCGKSCQVPFKPTGSKPVFCSDCFRQNEGERDGRRDFAPRSQSTSISTEQFKQINVKLDKILSVLQDLEINVEEGLEEEAEEEKDSDD